MPKESPSSTAVPRGITKVFTFWQDREIRFDATADVFNLRPNVEEVLATFHHVEDTKGNNGQTGTLMITNLRMIWWSARHRTVNLSIGYYCVLNVTVQETQSKLFGGTAEALFVSCKFGASRFMFVFTYVPRDIGSGQGGGRGGVGGGQVDGKARLYTAVSAAWRAYDSTRIYREIRLRAAIISEGTLLFLDGEQILSKVPDVTNVSKDTEHPGVFLTTNLRVVWFARREENFNVSIPYMQFTAVRSQNTRFGPALVIETSNYAGNFVLGFRVEPVERLVVLFQEIASLWKAWTVKPIMGMRISVSTTATGSGEAGAGIEESFLLDGDSNGACGGGDKNGSAARGKGIRDTAEGILEQAPGDAFAAYYADEGQKGSDRKPTYNSGIGLAVEKLRKGVTLQDLWSVTVT